MNSPDIFRKRILYLLMALTSLPFVFIVDRPLAFGLTGDAWISTARYVASVLGYIGISLLVWQLILGTRTVSGLFFENLPAKLKLHSRLGKYGLLLVFLHPLLILVPYGERLTYIFTPSLATEFEEHVTFGRLAFAGLITIWITSALIRGKIAYRPWKYIHYIAYPVLLAALLHVPEVGHSYNDQAIQFFWRLFIITVVVCVLLRGRHLLGIGKVHYQLSAKRSLSPQVWMYTFKPLNKAVMPHTGQYIYVQRSLLSEEHPFTILDFSKKTGEFSVAFKVFGRYTKRLGQMDIGDTVLVDGPYGVFTRQISEKPHAHAVFIAGGIGITPFVRHVLSRPKDASLLFYANQNRHGAVFTEALRSHLGENFIETYSRDTGAHPKHITYDLLKQYVQGDVKRRHFYICGPSGMMKDVSRYLRALGVKPNHIHIEDFSF